MKRQRVQGADSSIDFDASNLPPLPQLPDKHAQRPFLHPSFAASQLAKRHPGITKNLRSEVEFRSYEPYEFIGDRILSTMIITALKLLYPKATCGTLNKLNQLFTTNAMFAAFGYEYGFGDRILMGTSAPPSQKTVADAFEAYFGVLWYHEIERTALLGLSGALRCDLTNTLFPEDGSAGTSTSAKAAGKKRAREEVEEESKPFASMLKYVVELLRNAFPTLSAWVAAREARRSLPMEQQIALRRSNTGRPTTSKPYIAVTIGLKAMKRKRKKLKMRESRRRRRLTYGDSGNPADHNAERDRIEAPARTYETRSYLSKTNKVHTDKKGNLDDQDYEYESELDDDDDSGSDDDIIFVAVKGPATAESQAALRTPIRVIDLSEDTTDESEEDEDEDEDSRDCKRVKHDSRSATPFNPRPNIEDTDVKSVKSKPPVIQASSDEEDDKASRSSSGEAGNVSASLIQKSGNSNSSSSAPGQGRAVSASGQGALRKGTTDQPFELSDDDDSED